MSSSASFWAAKSEGVTSPQAPTQAAAPVTQQQLPAKSTVMLRGTTKSIKKTNWADSDDEEEFIASFTSPSRIQELERTITAKDTHIADLASLLQQKNCRIAELDSALEEQELRLIKLQDTVEASAARVEELEKDNRKQSLHVQKLVADVDEKDRRITALEVEIDEQCATIAELDGGDDSTQVSSHEAAEAPKVDLADSKAKVDDYEMTEQMPQAKDGVTEDTEATTSAKTSLAKSTGPAVNQSHHTIFATTATIKQIPPPPPAPKLKMPLDLSKFAKKSATKTVSPEKKSKAATIDASNPGPAIKLDPTADIRTKSFEERVLFAKGPKVQVKMGETTLATVPKYVLMQCSAKAYRHFSDNVDSVCFELPAGSMETAAATAHLVWMKEMTYQNRVYSITLHSGKQFDDKNLHICRAARVLGLNNMYVGHFTKIFCDRIRSNTASTEFLAKVVAVAYPENDPIYDCLANNLANLRLRKTVNNPAEVEALFQKNKGLKAKVEKIEERMSRKKESNKPTKGPMVVHIGKQMDV
ncbi:hypothetical protein OPT61_g1280 [Boeremia exigua]|uniref:Uncharacterized protein n=1 Tax=Boeremia exigua TaxID=749465 RepID=A0ACC2IQY4_9PLEO|nr:hypothetical protein OPT61_g1280 [Boeremia exigua]